eukprot:2002930-Alexandrium_andersonii.AAC.1
MAGRTCSRETSTSRPAASKKRLLEGVLSTWHVVATTMAGPTQQPRAPGRSWCPLERFLATCRQ